MVKLTRHQKQQIAERLLGSCTSAARLADELGLDPFDGDLEVAIAAESEGVVMCGACGWWVEEADCSWEVVERDPICNDCEAIT